LRMMIWTCAAVLLVGNLAEAAEKGAPLDGAKCHVLWTLISPKGDAITKYKADPNVIDFTMVDTDHDGTIDANEFIAGCKDGWIRGQ
jgi:hypothetical protein